MNRWTRAATATLAKKAVDGSCPPDQVWNGQAAGDDQNLLDWAAANLGPKLRSTADRRQQALCRLSPLCWAFLGLARADSPSLDSAPTSATREAPSEVSAPQIEAGFRIMDNPPAVAAESGSGAAKTKSKTATAATSSGPERRRPTADERAAAEPDTGKEQKRAFLEALIAGKRS
jgi:hypothetical protein